ncbi:MAG: ribonuclease HI [Spirochaetia bacterium]|nr:ribonuclease HI [Spirochaetia bacterium]
MSDVTIYTDGGCSGNPGPGGWAYVVLDGQVKFSFSGGERFTTNNRMELTAVINALSFVADKYTVPVSVFTDSQYVKNGITTWIKNWLRNNWKTADRKDVKNKELWQQLYMLDRQIHPQWCWVKGHAGNTYNELCDSMVRAEMSRFL